MSSHTVVQEKFGLHAVHPTRASVSKVTDRTLAGPRAVHDVPEGGPRRLNVVERAEHWDFVNIELQGALWTAAHIHNLANIQ